MDTQTEAQLAAAAHALLTEAARWKAAPSTTLTTHGRWQDIHGRDCTGGGINNCWRLTDVDEFPIDGRRDDLNITILTMTAELGVGCVFVDPTPADPTPDAQQCNLFGQTEVQLRACAGRRSLGAPAVSPVDEFGGEKQRYREGELGESVSWPAVGVAA